LRKKFLVVLDGELYEVEVEIEEPGDIKSLLQAFRTGVVKRVSMEAPSAKAVEGAVVAPLTGRVVEVRVRPGDRVDRSTVVAVLEAMKTRVEVRAGREGTVLRVLVREGESVRQGDPLVLLS